MVGVCSCCVLEVLRYHTRLRYLVGKLGYDLMLGFRFVEVPGVLTDYATRTIYVRHTSAYYNKSRGEETRGGHEYGVGNVRRGCNFSRVYLRPCGNGRYSQAL